MSLASSNTPMWPWRSWACRHYRCRNAALAILAILAVSLLGPVQFSLYSVKLEVYTCHSPHRSGTRNVKNSCLVHHVSAFFSWRSWHSTSTTALPHALLLLFLRHHLMATSWVYGRQWDLLNRCRHFSKEWRTTTSCTGILVYMYVPHWQELFHFI